MNRVENVLPRFIRDMFSMVPMAGEGLHNWLFKTARVLHRYRSEHEIFELLTAATFNRGRYISEREIINAIRNSKKDAWNPGQNSASGLKSRPWPDSNHEQIEAVVKDGPELVDLWEVSPLRFDDNLSHTEEILDAIFPGDPLLCIGKSTYEFATHHRKTWRGRLAALSLIVPSPMSTKYGRTLEGKRSEHCLDNTGARHFLVIEFDQGTRDQHAALIWHLQSEYLPLAMVLFSGYKSLHGWFYVKGIGENILKLFMRKAVVLGADPATWTRSQFVRMPDGLRDNGEKQTVFFFNPEVIK